MTIENTSFIYSQHCLKPVCSSLNHSFFWAEQLCNASNLQIYIYVEPQNRWNFCKTAEMSINQWNFLAVADFPEN